MTAARHYCWQCYALNHEPAGRCVRCGGEIAAPDGTTYQQRLIWALDHPDGDKAIIAAASLGRVGDREAASRLHDVATGHRDPYLAAEALRSLIAIDTLEEHRELVGTLARAGAAPVRAAAREALDAVPREHTSGG